MDEEKKVCQVCGAEVESQDELDTHMAEVHGQSGGDTSGTPGGDDQMPAGGEDENEDEESHPSGGMM